MIEFFLLLSLIGNIILFWYTRKIVEKLSYGVDNVDQLQNLLDEYCASMEGVYELEAYYGDETIAAAIKNTKLVIETCKVYKKTILEDQEDQEKQLGK